MAYERLNLKTGDELNEAVFKHIDDGISQAIAQENTYNLTTSTDLLKDSFEYLYVFYSKNQILLIPSVHQFEQNELKSISNDLPTLCEYSPKFDFSLLDNDYKLSFYKYKIEILKPISMYIEKNVDNTSFISLLKSSLISELFGRLQQYFSYPNIVLMDDNSNVKVLVASKKEINLELLKTTPSAFLGSCRFKLPNDYNDDIYIKILEYVKKRMAVLCFKSKKNCRKAQG